MPIFFQRIEGAVIFAASLYFYLATGSKFVWFVLLLLSIDITMLGYLVSNKVGAYVYNLGHSYTLPVLLIFFGYSTSQSAALAFGLIWLAHCGLDRALSYGLKLPSGFKDTHLGPLGNKRSHE